MDVDNDIGMMPVYVVAPALVVAASRLLGLDLIPDTVRKNVNVLRDKVWEIHELLGLKIYGDKREITVGEIFRRILQYRENRGVVERIVREILVMVQRYRGSVDDR